LRFNKIAFLTIIFPAQKDFLYKFLDSLKNQTYKNFDLIIVNDGYGSLNRIKKKFNDSINIIEIKSSNTPAKNREIGINYCIDSKYEILIFGDSDDWFKNNRIEVSLKYLIDNDIVVNDLSLFNEDGIYEEKYISNRVNNLEIIDKNFISDKNIFGMTNTAIKLKDMSHVTFEDSLVAVDWYFFELLLNNGLKAIFTNETLSFYRQHNNNTIGLNIIDNEYFLWWEKK
jgi:glycosyltransferase involved in cell wall biosynthesis